MSTEIASSSPLPELPSEIWLNIFRLATFIPLETDLSVTKLELGLFSTYDSYHLQAFEKVLPLRRTIVQVSRRFYEIGIEILYTTFHIDSEGIINSVPRSLLFSNLLVSRPELGRFVKRLSLQWTDEDEEKNYRIISRCPNVFIFSSFQPVRYVGRRPWWGRGLPKTIRCFDARVYNTPVNDIVSLLEALPNLELLHLWPLTGYPNPHAPVCLSALRILSIHCSNIDHDTSPSPTFLSGAQLPSVITLATNVAHVHARLSLPLNVLRGLVYLQAPGAWAYSGHHSDHFHNLRCLEIPIIQTAGLQPCLAYFPFHQLERLTVIARFITTSEWRRSVEAVVVTPLDARTMPKLKHFQLTWGYHGIYGYYHQIVDEAGDGEDFIEYFENLVRRFEERNVLFVVTNNEVICPGFQLVRDVLVACKRS